MNILKKIKKISTENGDRIAIKSDDSCLSYGQLDAYSDKLAAWIYRN